MRQTKELQDIHAESLAEFGDIWSIVEPERKQCLEDRKFYSLSGAQWAGALGEQFENKPRFEVNKTHLAVLRVINEARNNPIRADFVSRDGKEAGKLADTCDMLLRADEQDSNAEEAKSNGFEEAIGGGFGAWRLRADYEDEDDPEDERQRICFEPINDADQCVFFDLDAKRQDKSDARRCYVLTPMTRNAYKDEWGDEPTSWPADMKDSWGDFQWLTPDYVYVAEVYRVEEKKQWTYVYRTLTGEEESYTDKDFEEDETLEETLQASGLREIRRKRTEEKRVRKLIMSGSKVLEDCGYIAGKNIPIVPIYGKRWFIEGIERVAGHVRYAKDPQRLANMLRSKVAEIAAFSSVEKPIFAPEQITPDVASMWSDDNVKDYPYLLAHPLRDISGNPIQMGPTGYTKSPQIPPAVAALMQVSEQDLSDVLGNQQAGEQVVSNISGKAVEMIQDKLDMQSYIYLSNRARAEKRSGEIWLSMARELYAQKGRTMRGIGKDGQIAAVEIKRPVATEQDGQAFENDIAAANFQITTEVGPTSKTMKRGIVRDLTAIAATTTDPQTRAVIESLIIMNMDGEGMSDVNKWARQRLVGMGAIQPTDEERKQMAEAQANARPDANQQYLEAAAQEAQAKAVKAAADTDLTKAKTLETLANVEASNTDQALAVLDRIQPAQTDVSVVAVPENPPGL